MNKKSRLILITVVAIVLVMSMVLSACQSFKWGPVGTITKGDVANNGSIVLEQEGYLYYINGKDDVATLTDAYANHFGKASVKASIMKSKISEDGSLVDTEVLVPKMYNNTNTNNGLWIYEDWIYYTSPSTQTDNKGTVLVDKLEYMRTKLDGTKTQTLAIIENAGLPYTVTSNALIYAEGDKIMKVPFDNKKVKKAEVVAEKVTSTLFTAKSNVIFFTKATEDKTLNGNLVYVMNGNSEPVQIVNEKTFAANKEAAPLLNEQKTISLTQYSANENVLYYTQTDNDARAQVGTYGYKFGETFEEIVPANAKKYAVSSVTKFLPLGYEQGILDISAAKIFKYNVIDESSIDNKGEGIELSAAPTILFTEDNYLYYIVNGKLMRMQYASNEEATTAEGFKFIEESICNETMSTSWFAPVKVGDYIYYIDETTSYLHRVNYKKYVIDENRVIIKPLGEIVSGYEDNDKVEGGKAPKFMTEADKKTWIDAHPIKDNKD